MKSKSVLILVLLVSLVLSACGVNVPTKSADDKTASTDPFTLPVTSQPAGQTDPAVQPDPGKETALFPGLKSSYDPADLPQNNLSYNTTSGRVVHAYGGTWFVQKGLENDGRENGFPYSDNIYFLSDEPGSEAILVGSVPSDVTDNIQQLTVFFLAPGPDTPEGRFLYFTGSNGSKSILRRIDLKTKEVETLPYQLAWIWDYNSFCRDADKLYFYAYEAGFTPGGDSYRRPDLMVLDLTDGTIVKADFSLPVKQGEIARTFAIDSGYVYYVRAKDISYEPYGFYRMRLGSTQEEEVAPVTSEEIEYAMVAGPYLIYRDDERDEMVFLSVESGKEVLGVPEDVADIDDLPWTICEDVLYYFEDGNLKMIDLSSGEISVCIEGKDRYILLVTYTADAIWFMDEDDYGIYKVSKTGRILPASPIVPVPDMDLYNRENKQREGDWLYEALPHCSAVVAYTGQESDVTIPVTLGGKPVTLVHLDLRDNESVQKLTIPEGVISLIDVSCNDHVKEVLLPKSLEYMTVRGFDYTLHLAAGTLVQYAGTMGEWNDLCEKNRELYDVAVGSPKNPVDEVSCSDGVWMRID